MANRAMKAVASRPAFYALTKSVIDIDGRVTERAITSDQLNRMTPQGTPIAATREEIVSVLTRSAEHIRQSHPIIEAAGGIRAKTNK